MIRSSAALASAILAALAAFAAAALASAVCGSAFGAVEGVAGGLAATGWVRPCGLGRSGAISSAAWMGVGGNSATVIGAVVVTGCAMPEAENPVARTVQTDSSSRLVHRDGEAAAGAGSERPGSTSMAASEIERGGWRRGMAPA
ncbi:hypothetical protein [Azospirillum sp. TSH64]|uniref:hypothetical protein n=1 Tax=Azospirillum sp. TSH64 TaxID=652740 RepID=UPI001FFF5AC0|nr:hypothetical protein [Azospirillum sp. TSH64]